MIDLLQHLIGPLELCSTGAARNDYVADDPTVAAMLTSTEGVSVHLATGAAEDYALFELQLVTAKGVIAIEQGGFLWRERLVKESPHFAGYRLVSEDVRRAGGAGQAMRLAATNIHDAVTKGAALASTGETALSAQILCDKIRSSPSQLRGEA